MFAILYSLDSTPSMRFLVKAGLVLAAVAVVLFASRYAGPALVVDRPQHSDLIVVLAGDGGDQRYWKALSLLRAGYAPQVVVDAKRDSISYGRTPAELAGEFVKRTATGDLSGHVSVCPTTGDSTRMELRSAVPCFERFSPRAIMIVTSDYHSRRALSIARKELPRYGWTVAATDSGLLSEPKWWTDRYIAKIVFLEWQKMAWWEVVERHR
jgi:uncharacterized SAM-binding protein YcdF (DUF218 family)